MKTEELTLQKEGAIEETSPTPASLIQMAIQQNLDIEKLERLMQLQERWEANKSRKEFFDALADFQFKCPVIMKNKKADFPSSKGGRVTYNFAPLDQIISQIKGALRNSGLSYRWEYSEKEKDIQVTCLITHKSGHTEKTTFSSVSDTSGSKNEIQSDGSTLTYMRRYTLCGALGIATAEDDIDGGRGDSDALYSSISGAATKEDLKKIWDENISLQKNARFIQAVNKKKAELK